MNLVLIIFKIFIFLNKKLVVFGYFTKFAT